MFAPQDYVVTGEAILGCLRQNKYWQRLEDLAHDGNGPKEQSQRARRQSRRLKEDFVAEVAKLIIEAKLEPYLLPSIRLESPKMGKELRAALEYLAKNPCKRRVPSARLAALIAKDNDYPPQSNEAARKSVDRAKRIFEDQGWWKFAPLCLRSRYFELRQFNDALWSGDSKKLPLENQELQFTDGKLYFHRKNWGRLVPDLLSFLSMVQK